MVAWIKLKYDSEINIFVQMIIKIFFFVQKNQRLRSIAAIGVVAMMLKAFFALQMLGLGHSRRSCYTHEDVRMGEVWVVDCRGNAVQGPLDVLELGEFRFEAGDHEWSSRDSCMSAVTIDLPDDRRCSNTFADRLARCVEIPREFVQCLDEFQVRLVGDTTFPRYASVVYDIVDAANICAPENSTVLKTHPLRAYNKRDVLEQRANNEFVQNITLAVLAAIVACAVCIQKVPPQVYTRVKSAERILV